TASASPSQTIAAAARTSRSSLRPAPGSEGRSAGSILPLWRQKATKMNNTTKIALVTGGSRGLGKDMALRLAERGLDVIITYNTRAEDAQRIVTQIEAGGQKAAALQLDTGAIQRFGTFTDRLTAI